MIKKNLTLIALATVFLVAGTVSCGDSSTTTTETTVSGDSSMVPTDTMSMPQDTTKLDTTSARPTLPTKTPD
jgi:hypothetical protein